MEHKKMMEYRLLRENEAERIAEIDAVHYIENAWRIREETGKYELVRIDWTDAELPNGFEWHLRRLKETIASGGAAFGCFSEGALVGYGTVDREIFGTKEKYVLMDQLFVSQALRGKGIGKKLFLLCAEKAKEFGAEKLFLSAASAENTVAFYKSVGCVSAAERQLDIEKEDPMGIQFEFSLCKEGIQ